VKFVTGSETLRGATEAVSGAFHFDFPDVEQKAKVVRRGILNCPAAGTICQFVLIPPETVQSLD